MYTIQRVSWARDLRRGRGVLNARLVLKIMPADHVSCIAPRARTASRCFSFIASIKPTVIVKGIILQQTIRYSLRGSLSLIYTACDPAAIDWFILERFPGYFPHPVFLLTAQCQVLRRRPHHLQSCQSRWLHSICEVFLFQVQKVCYFCRLYSLDCWRERLEISRFRRIEHSPANSRSNTGTRSSAGPKSSSVIALITSDAVMDLPDLANAWSWALGCGQRGCGWVRHGAIYAAATSVSLHLSAS